MYHNDTFKAEAEPHTNVSLAAALAAALAGAGIWECLSLSAFSSLNFGRD